MDLTNLTEEDTRTIMEEGIESMKIHVKNYPDNPLGRKMIDWKTKQEYCNILKKVFGQEHVDKLNKGKYKNE